MPALDSCHLQIVHALEKSGWHVAPNQLGLDTPLNNLFVDIVAHRSVEIGDQEMIVVEAKCFPKSSSGTTELYVAIGQYLVYRELLIANQIDSPIYLAIPTDAYQTIFKAIGMSVVTKSAIKLIVIDLEREEIEQWLE
jgi:hypothetical protein